MHHIDEPLVIGIALLIAGEVAEIAAGGEHRVDARDGGNLASLRRAAQGFANSKLVPRSPIYRILKGSGLEAS